MDKESKHVGPHLHQAIEFVYVTKGTLELGVGEELYHMEEGDLGIVFPNLIHHYQVFSKGSRGYYILAGLEACGGLKEALLRYSPEFPVIPKKEVPWEVTETLQGLLKAGEADDEVMRAYVQILLHKSLPCLCVKERIEAKENDLVYEWVVYMAAHFREEVTLTKMAEDLGVSKYKLSRVCSRTFHKNFNQYLNETRLSYACELLEYTNSPITEVCIEAGFESQRTFNRVFREQYHLTPREYRRSQRIRHFRMARDFSDR